MVNWVGYGTLSGYGISVDNEGEVVSDAGEFRFSGSTDSNIITRFQYNLLSGGVPSQRTRVFAAGGFDLTGAGAGYPAGSLPPGTWIGWASMAIAPASDFNSQPTPAQILNNHTGTTIVVRGELVTITPDGNYFAFNGPNPQQLEPNKKYWVVMYPSYVRSSEPPSLENDRIAVRGREDFHGKALSFWTNRKPDKPNIVSPRTGTYLAPGNDYMLTIGVSDSDRFGTAPATTSLAAFRGFNGVQVQYSAQPSEANPDPVWQNMKIKSTTGVFHDLAYIENTPSATNNLAALLFYMGNYANQLQGTMDVGAITPAETGDGKIALPPGTWRIRARTFDSGHPYSALPPIYGVPGQSYLEVDNYPAANTSDWSNYVTVTVPEQVPPPIPIYPRNGVAVAPRGSIRFEFQYRNTANPPKAQFGKSIRVREVGDPNWTLVVWDYYSPTSGEPFYDVWAPNPDLILASIDKGEFEPAGELNDKWSIRYGNLEPHQTYPSKMTNIDGTWGNISEVTPVTTPRYLVRQEELPSGSDKVRAKFSLYFPGGPSDPILVGGIYYGVIFYGADRGYLSEVTLHAGAGSPEPITFDQTLTPPSGAAYVTLYVYPINYSDPTLLLGTGVADVLIDANNAPVGPHFNFLPTRQYEWQALTVDTDMLESQWSDTARFWVVPPPGNGINPGPDASLAAASLGCGTHKVFVTRRGGEGPLIPVPNPTMVRWERVRDDISTATVEFESWDTDCGGLLRDLRTWAYEVVIYRETVFGSDRVWEGPLTRIKYEKGKVTLAAQDVMGYLNRRVIKHAYNDIKEGRSVVARAEEIIQTSLAPEDPNLLDHLVVFNRPDDATQHRYLAPYATYVFTEVDDMASSAGLDYTVAGRSIILWGVKNRIGLLPLLTDEDLGASPIVTEYGAQMATDYYVTDGNGNWGGATRATDYTRETFGSVEMLVTEWSSEADEQGQPSQSMSDEKREKLEAGFREQAEKGISDRYPAPVTVRVPEGTSLNPDATVSIQNLIPGVHIPVRSAGTLREVQQMQKLDSVKVEERAGKETVVISMSPINSDGTEDVEI